jgi:riboflavin kinase/FMN adenylyltransferase
MRENDRDCAVIPPAYLGDRVISSSAIRAAVEAGDTELAAAMLGRPFSLTAPVLRGRGFGHTEGVPTVNQVFCTSGIVPKSGVYATRVLLDGGRVVQGVSNVGTCPTFFGETGDLRCETHLIDYSEDLYGKTLTVQFCRYLRPEKKFGSVEELYEQIRRDLDAARELPIKK